MKYVVPVSGGKDSQVVLAMVCREFGPDNVIAVHNNTGFDHELTYKHLNYMALRYGVSIHHTLTEPGDVLTFVERSRRFPSGKARTCTDHFKLKAQREFLRKHLSSGDQYVLFLGVRSGESQQRANKYAGLDKTDQNLYDLFPGKYPKAFRAVEVRLPVLEWSTADIFKYLAHSGDRVNPLYAMGFDRVGCFPCLLAGENTYRLAYGDPAGRRRIIQIHDLATRFPARGKTFVLRGGLAAMLAGADVDPFGLFQKTEIGCHLCQE